MFKYIRFVSWLAMMVLSMLLLACSGEGTQTPATPEPTPAPTPSSEVKLELRPIVASTDLALGDNRFVFAILDSESTPIRSPEVGVTFLYLGESKSEAKATMRAQFRRWPTGQEGVYTTNVAFDETGQWGIEVSVQEADGSSKLGRSLFEVKKESSTPAIGSPAISSSNRTARDVGSLEELTTDPDPDPDLYQLTISEAIATKIPTVMTFATPAFCSTATCGPQVEIVKELKSKYSEQANFIHVEIYSNPLEMGGDVSKGRLAEAVFEWALPSEPWTFILNDDGKVSAKFEGFVTLHELEDALTLVIG